MDDSLEAQELDSLEDELLSANVSFGEMTCQYARYLLSLIDRGLFKAISNSKLEILAPYLKEGAMRERIENNESLRKALALELWEIERQYRRLDGRFADLVRCTLFCFETEERWIEEGTGDVTPIYLYFLILKKILPSIRRDFIESFQRFIRTRNTVDLTGDI
ncbi:hypothetical protein YA0002_01050 [Pseudomonas cichorii]|nr:hypothetical protein [Pseudomonas cichorii]